MREQACNSEDEEEPRTGMHEEVRPVELEEEHVLRHFCLCSYFFCGRYVSHIKITKEQHGEGHDHQTASAAGAPGKADLDGGGRPAATVGLSTEVCDLPFGARGSCGLPCIGRRRCEGPCGGMPWLPVALKARGGEDGGCLLYTSPSPRD
eukprot:9212250-Alexandrium_andersonii.AAC.1